MAVSKEYLEYLLGQLKGLGGVEARRMFGGLGLYSRGTFFGLLYKDRLYFKTDESTRPEYMARGSEGFQPRAGVKAQMTYYTVPAEILEDEDEIVQWARKAVTAALAKDAMSQVKATRSPKKRTTKRAKVSGSGSRRPSRRR
jgi:DNA transformation protein